LVHDGGVGALHYAYNKPQRFDEDPSYEEVGPVRLERLDVNFAEMISSLETEFAKATRARTVAAKDGRAMLVYVGEKGGGATASDGKSGRKFTPEGNDRNARLRELRELARTAGVEVADVVVQQRERIDPKYVLGKGKLEDVILRAMQLDVQTLIFDCELSPSQASAIASVTDLKIIDRTQLILDIFAQRAESRDGRLQVELAQLKYALPRLNQKDDALSRLTGGIGGRGPGETKLEIGRRRAKERLHHLEEQVDMLAKQRTERRRARKKSSVPVVAIVGYTNAGKSTLMNTLTGANVLAEDKLFATLDTRSRKLFLPSLTPDSPGREVILVDTVGLVRDLPQDLFAAFRATFEEAADADLLVNLVDASDPARERHIETTEAVLEELDLKSRPRLVVYNKTDLLPQGDAERLALGKPWAVAVSAVQKPSLAKLLARIAEMLTEGSTPPRGEGDGDQQPMMIDGYFVTA
jgi:GTP-binding protein HflX